jgi:MerR family transcriptional regulator, copper efflux regulator
VLIAEFAKTTGLPRDTVRYYEKLGLLKPVAPRQGSNSYRHYAIEDVERAKLIRLGQALGFTLREIKSLMQSWESKTLSVDKKVALMRQKIEEIDARVAHLKAVRRYFQAKIKWIECSGKGAPPAFVPVAGAAPAAKGAAR